MEDTRMNDIKSAHPRSSWQIKGERHLFTKFYLFERQRNKVSIFCFTSQMPTTAQAGPRLKPQAENATQVSTLGIQVTITAATTRAPPGPSQELLPRLLWSGRCPKLWQFFLKSLARSWIASGAAKKRTSTHRNKAMAGSDDAMTQTPSIKFLSLKKKTSDVSNDTLKYKNPAYFFFP